ncbi:hypothetical protein, partial [Escherichia coli]|uniref:hypothetical protein n=1 Tax=Escherichia coli TaxID=562 RepID=UPI0010CB7038
MKVSSFGGGSVERLGRLQWRTFVVCVRSELGFLSAGVGLLLLSPVFATPFLRVLLSLFLFLFSGGFAMYGYLRWLRNEKAMRLKEDLP